MSRAGTSKRGGNSNISKKRIDAIVEAASLGCTRALQAKAAGISPGTLYRWIADGKQPKANGLRRELVQRLEKAEADGATKLLQQVRAAAETDGRWQAAAWLLERRYGYNRSGAATTIRENQEIEGLQNLTEIDAIRRQLREVGRANQLSLEGGSFQAYVAGQRLARQLWADLAVALGHERNDPVEDLNSEEFRAELAEAMGGWPDQLLELAIRCYERRHSMRLLGVANGRGG